MPSLEENIRSLIHLRTQMSQLENDSVAVRLRIFNQLGAVDHESLDVDGYRVSRFRPRRQVTYTRDSVSNGLSRVLGLSHERILDVLVASQIETELTGDVVLRRLGVYTENEETETTNPERNERL